MSDRFEARKLIENDPELKGELQDELDPDSKLNELFANSLYKVKGCYLYRARKSQSHYFHLLT